MFIVQQFPGMKSITRRIAEVVGTIQYKHSCLGSGTMSINSPGLPVRRSLRRACHHAVVTACPL